MAIDKPREYTSRNQPYRHLDVGLATSKTEKKQFFRIYLFIFRERGREGEIEGEKHQGAVASHMPCTGDLACNPGRFPDW